MFPRLAVPIEFEISEIFGDPVVVFRPDACVVDVFKTEKKAASVFPSEIVGHPGGVGMTKVESASGTGGESSGDHGTIKKVLARP